MSFVCYILQEEDEQVDEFDFQQLYDLQNGCRVTALAWSPETSVVSLPKVIRLVIFSCSVPVIVMSLSIRMDRSGQTV